MLSTSPNFSAVYAVINLSNHLRSAEVVAMAVSSSVDPAQAKAFAFNFTSRYERLTGMDNLFPVSANPSWRIGEILTLERVADQFTIEQLQEWAKLSYVKAADNFKESASAANYRDLQASMVVHQQASQIRDLNLFRSSLLSMSLEDAVCVTACGLTLAEVKRS